jgi:hypothetical protein
MRLTLRIDPNENGLLNPMDQIINLILPILIVVLAGYCAARFHVLDKGTGNVLCQYLFYFSLPFLTFTNIYRAGLDNLLNGRFILTAILTIFGIILLAYFVFRFLFQSEGQNLIMMIFGSFYVNATYVGVPVASMILSSVVPPLIILMIQASFFFPLTVFLMDVNSGKQSRINFKDSLLLLVRNPILVATLIAIVLLVFQIRVPQFVLTTTELFGKPAAATGLFALGFTCYLPADQKITKSEIRRALTVTLFKTFLQPLLAWSIGRFVFHLDSWWLTAIVVCAMLPTAVNHFIVSQKYRCSENESKLIILFTTFGFTIMVSLFLYFSAGF